MNKMTKGALAAAAAAAILAGGAGTMAAWNSQSSLGSGSVTAGTLNIEQVGTGGTWHWNTEDGAAFNPATDRLVPGDTVVYVGEYRITAVGTHLTATLKPSVAGVTGELANLLDVAPSAARRRLPRPVPSRPRPSAPRSRSRETPRATSARARAHRWRASP